MYVSFCVGQSSPFSRRHSLHRHHTVHYTSQHAKAHSETGHLYIGQEGFVGAAGLAVVGSKDDLGPPVRPLGRVVGESADDSLAAPEGLVATEGASEDVEEARGPGKAPHPRLGARGHAGLRARRLS